MSGASLTFLKTFPFGCTSSCSSINSRVPRHLSVWPCRRTARVNRSSSVWHSANGDRLKDWKLSTLRYAAPGANETGRAWDIQNPDRLRENCLHCVELRRDWPRLRQGNTDRLRGNCLHCGALCLTETRLAAPETYRRTQTGLEETVYTVVRCV